MPPPGYLVHTAAFDPKVLKQSKLALLGLIAPDFWKKHTPSKEEYLAFFGGCQGAPSYEQVLLLCSLDHGGTHFGSNPRETDHADFSLLRSMFSTGQLDAENIFFYGYVHHLLADKMFYANRLICDQAKFSEDRSIDSNAALARLHNDWDKTNAEIIAWFPEVKLAISTMPSEVQKVIGFAEGPPTYVALEHMRRFIEMMRQPQNLEQLLAAGEINA